MLFDLEEEVPEGEWLVQLGEASVRREGTYLTVVAYSLEAIRVVEAAGSGRAREIGAQWFDKDPVPALGLEAWALVLPDNSNL